MRLAGLLAALLSSALLAAGCSSPPGPGFGDPAGTADAGPEGTWAYKASRDIMVDGRAGEACAAMEFLVPAAATSLLFHVGAAIVTGNGVLEPEGAGYVRPRLVGPDGAEVALAPMGAPAATDVRPAGYEATVEAPAPGAWRVEVEPDSVAVSQEARAVWELEGAGPEPLPAALAASDAACA